MSELQAIFVAILNFGGKKKLSLLIILLFIIAPLNQLLLPLDIDEENTSTDIGLNQHLSYDSMDSDKLTNDLINNIDFPSLNGEAASEIASQNPPEIQESDNSISSDTASTSGHDTKQSFGFLEIDSKDLDGRIETAIEVWETNPQGELIRISNKLTTDVQETVRVDVPEGFYRIKAIQSTELLSEVIEIKNGKTERYTAEFEKLQLVPYSQSEDPLSLPIEIFDANNEVVWKTTLTSNNTQAPIWLTVGNYQIESPQYSWLSKGIYLEGYETVPIRLGRYDSDPQGLGLDSATFGELVVNTKTANDMPINVNIEIKNSSSQEIIVSTSVGTDGTISFDLAADNYDVITYKYSSNKIINTSQTVIAESTTEVDVNFAQLIVYHDIDREYIYLYNNETSLSVGTERYYDTSPNIVFYVSAEYTYDIFVKSPTSPTTTYADIAVNAGEQREFGTIVDKAPEFVSTSYQPSFASRVNANETTTVSMRVNDENFDFPFSLDLLPNLGSAQFVSSQWIVTNQYEIVFQYDAPSTDGTYYVDLAVIDDRNDYVNYTIYLSNRQTAVNLNSTGIGGAGIDGWIYAYNANSLGSSIVGSTRTYSDGLGLINLFDGQYYFVWDGFVDYVSPVYDINASETSFGFDYQWSIIGINSTGLSGDLTSASFRLYNTTQSSLLADYIQASTSSSSSMTQIRVPEYDSYAIRAYVTTINSLIYKTSVPAVAGEITIVDFTFGILAGYSFTEGGTAVDSWIRLYNGTESNTDIISSIRTYSDGVSLFTLAPYNNYTVRIDSENYKFYYNIAVDANSATAVGNFTNSAPVISSISASPRRIAPEENSTITVIASDSDVIDSLDYTWTVSEGSILGSGNSITYLAPSTSGVYKIEVNVTDQFGGSDTARIYVSSRTSSITFNVTRGDLVTFDGWVYLYDNITGSTVSTMRLYASNNGVGSFTSVYDGEYRIMARGSNDFYQEVFMEGSPQSVDFEFGVLNAIATTQYAEPLSAYVKVLDNSTGSLIRAYYTDSGTGLQKFILEPNTYDVQTESDGTSIFADEVVIPISGNVTETFGFARIYAYLTHGSGNPLDIWVYIEDSDTSSNYASQRAYSDGYVEFDVAPDNYTLRYGTYPNAYSEPFVIANGDRYNGSFGAGLIYVYTTDNGEPVSLPVQYRRSSDNFLIRSTNTGSDGYDFDILPANEYDIYIDNVYNQTVNLDPNEVVHVGDRYNKAPVIQFASADDIGAQESTIVTLGITDADYDYQTVTMSTSVNTGSVTDITYGFISQDNFRITFNYSSSILIDYYQINITISDGFGGEDTYVLYVSDLVNTVNVFSYIDDETPQNTPVYIYDVQSGSTIVSSFIGNDGFQEFSIVDGFYRIVFDEDNNYEFKDVVIRGGNSYNYTVEFGVLDVYVTGANAIPLDVWVQVYNGTTDALIASERTYGDGLSTFVLTTGYYKVVAEATNDIVFYVSILGGQRSIVGSDTPQLTEPPEDIEYIFGQTGYNITWIFSEDDPDTYIIYRDDVLIESGAWDGSSITIAVDGLDPGLYEFEIYVNDTNGLPNVDTVFVTVLEGDPPFVNAYGTTALSVGSDETVNILFNASSLAAKNYTVYINGNVNTTQVWNGGDISVGFQSGTLGEYNVTILVQDDLDRQESFTVIVTVFDDDDPLLTSPSDITFEEGETGNSVSWIVTDVTSGNYTIFVDGEAIQSNVWISGDDITLNLNGYPFGIYLLTLIVEDSQGNTQSDSVNLEVTDTVLPVITNLQDFSMYYDELPELLSWQATDTNADEYFIYLNNVLVQQGGYENNNNVTYSFLDALVGLNNLTIFVTDLAGNSAVDTIIIDVSRPENSISAPEDFSIYVNEIANISWNVVSRISYNYSILIDQEEVLFATNNGNISVDFSNKFDFGGQFNITIVLNDQYNRQSVDTILITVVLTDLSITFPEDQFVTIVELVNITWTVTAASDFEYIINIDGEVYERSNKTGSSTLQFLSYLDLGLHEVSLNVTDQYGRTLLDTVFVTIVYPELSITSPDDLLVYAEDETSFNWTLVTSTNSQYTISVNGNEINSVNVTQTTTITFTDTFSIDGEYIIQISVVDNYDRTVSDTVLITVTLKPELAISDVGDFAWYKDVEFMINWTLEGDGDLSYSLYLNSSIVSSGIVTSRSIEFAMKLDRIGVQNLTLVITDTYQQVVSDEVLVIVADTPVPEIEGQATHEHDVKSSFELEWTVRTVIFAKYNLTVDGIVVLEGTMNGSTSWQSVIFESDLSIGTYTIVIAVNNGYRVNSFSTTLDVVSNAYLEFSDTPSPIITSVSKESTLIAWIVDASSGGSYIITVDNEKQVGGDWISMEAITYSFVIPEDLGAYLVVLSVVSEEGLQATHSVIVTVTEASETESSGLHSSIWMILILPIVAFARRMVVLRKR